MSLEFDPATPYEAWRADTQRLLEVSRSIQWLVGDALAFGEQAYGEQASQVLDPDLYAYDSVAKMARTSRAIPPDRRRPHLGYTVHAEVAALPMVEQEALLDHAERNESTSAEIRTLARRAAKRLAWESYAARGAPSLPDGYPRLAVADARGMPLPDACVDLTVTSPPYALEVGYGQGDVAPADWPAFMAAWLSEALRVTRPHGRLALNVPLDTARGGYRPTYAQAVRAALMVGWEYRGTIVWHDGATTKGNRALGSVDSADRPYHVSQVEMIVLLSKGDWGPSSGNPDDITPEEWQAAGRGPWQLNGEAHAWEGYPAAFPVALPTRLIKYLSRVGDVVLDCFVGSGSSAVAAHTSGRAFVGFDIDPSAVSCAARRLAGLQGQADGRAIPPRAALGQPGSEGDGDAVPPRAGQDAVAGSGAGSVAGLSGDRGLAGARRADAVRVRGGAVAGVGGRRDLHDGHGRPGTAVDAR